MTMISYEALRTLHISCVILSLSGFVLRGIFMLRQSPLLNHPLTRTLPHINDTILLGAALGLSIGSQQYPWSHAWLAAKLPALLVYIGLGMIAFRFGKTRRTKLVAWFAAIGVVLWMISVARLRNPLGIFALIPFI